MHVALSLFVVSLSNERNWMGERERERQKMKTFPFFLLIQNDCCVCVLPKGMKSHADTSRKESDGVQQRKFNFNRSLITIARCVCVRRALLLTTDDTIHISFLYNIFVFSFWSEFNETLFAFPLTSNREALARRGPLDSDSPVSQQCKGKVHGAGNFRPADHTQFTDNKKLRLKRRRIMQSFWCERFISTDYTTNDRF